VDVLRLPTWATPHEALMAETFSSPTRGNGERQPVVFMGFVNRSGSNHFGELLETTGRLTHFTEALTTDVISLRAKRGQTVAQYFSDEQRRLGGVGYGLKVSGIQLIYLHHSGALSEIDGKLISILRRDRIAQAVSFYLAGQSGHWHERSADDVPYDANSILLCLNGILDMERWLEIAIALTGYADHRVYYETSWPSRSM